MDNAKINEMRAAMLAAGIRLTKSRLVQGTWGNISMRIDDKYMLCTPSGLDYLSLKPEDMVVVNMETMEYEGNLKPTSEKGVHAGILKTRPEVNAIIHSHPRHCSVIACTGKEMPVINEAMQKAVGGPARVAVYGLPGTSKLTDGTVAAMVGRNACFMANHGAISCGKTLDEAFDNLKVLEECSKAYVEQKAMELTGEKTYSSALCKGVFLRNYGKK